MPPECCRFFHVYVAVVLDVSVTVAMYAVLQVSPARTLITTSIVTDLKHLQMYLALRKELSPHQPVLKASRHPRLRSRAPS